MELLKMLGSLSYSAFQNYSRKIIAEGMSLTVASKEMRRLAKDALNSSYWTGWTCILVLRLVIQGQPAFKFTFPFSSFVFHWAAGYPVLFFLQPSPTQHNNHRNYFVRTLS